MKSRLENFFMTLSPCWPSVARNPMPSRRSALAERTHDRPSGRYGVNGDVRIATLAGQQVLRHRLGIAIFRTFASAGVLGVRCLGRLKASDFGWTGDSRPTPGVVSPSRLSAPRGRLQWPPHPTSPSLVGQPVAGTGRRVVDVACRRRYAPPRAPRTARPSAADLGGRVRSVDSVGLGRCVASSCGPTRRPTRRFR